MAKQKTTTNTPAQWGPAESHRTEVRKGKTFTAYATCPFDPQWGIEQWGYEIHGSRETGIYRVVNEETREEEDREVPVVRLTGALPRRATYAEPDCKGWTLPAGLTLTPPFSEDGEVLLREMHLVDEYADAFTPLPDVLRDKLLTECGVAPTLLPRLPGPEIEAILRRHVGATAAPDSKPEVAHSPDFRSVLWHGTEYPFSPQQAEIVKVLWEAYECRTPDVDAALLLSGDFTGSAAKRVRDIFRNSTAWGTMIVPGGSKGTYRLTAPQ